MKVSDPKISATTDSNVAQLSVTIDYQDHVSALTEQVNQLMQVVVRGFRCFRLRFRGRFPTKTRSDSTPSAPDISLVCWYHNTFRKYPRKCTSPYNMAGN